MNCKDIQSILVSYLDNEISKSERGLILAHLEDCPDCKMELEKLAAFKNNLRQSLVQLANQQKPAVSAEDQLYARLRVLESLKRRGNLSIKTFWKGISTTMKPVNAIAMTLILLFAAVFAVPVVRAQILSALSGWFVFEDANCTELRCGVLRMDSDFGYVPFNPTYMPEDFWNRGTLMEGEPGALTLGMFYTDGKGFVAIIQKPEPTMFSLPTGKKVKVKDRPASLESGLQIELEWAPSLLQHSDVRRLTWVDQGVEIQILSDLPERKILQIAESMQSAPQMP